MHPVPAAVTACRYTWSCASPQAKTPGTFVAVESGAVMTLSAINEVSLLRETRQAARLRIVVDGTVRVAEMACDGVLIAAADTPLCYLGVAAVRRMGRLSKQGF